MLNALKLQVAKPLKMETGKGYTGMLGGVYLTDAVIHQHTVRYRYCEYIFETELRIAENGLAASARVNLDEVPSEVLKSVLEGSKAPEKALELLAELALLRVLIAQGVPSL